MASTRILCGATAAVAVVLCVVSLLVHVDALRALLVVAAVFSAAACVGFYLTGAQTVPGVVEALAQPNPNMLAFFIGWHSLLATGPATTSAGPADVATVFGNAALLWCIMSALTNSGVIGSSFHDAWTLHPMPNIVGRLLRLVFAVLVVLCSALSFDYGNSIQLLAGSLVRVAYLDYGAEGGNGDTWWGFPPYAFPFFWFNHGKATPENGAAAFGIRLFLGIVSVIIVALFVTFVVKCRAKFSAVGPFLVASAVVWLALACGNAAGGLRPADGVDASKSAWKSFDLGCTPFSWSYALDGFTMLPWSLCGARLPVALVALLAWEATADWSPVQRRESSLRRVRSPVTPYVLWFAVGSLCGMVVATFYGNSVAVGGFLLPVASVVAVLQPLMPEFSFRCSCSGVAAAVLVAFGGLVWPILYGGFYRGWRFDETQVMDGFGPTVTFKDMSWFTCGMGRLILLIVLTLLSIMLLLRGSPASAQPPRADIAMQSLMSGDGEGEEEEDEEKGGDDVAPAPPRVRPPAPSTPPPKNSSVLMWGLSGLVVLYVGWTAIAVMAQVGQRPPSS